MKDGLFRPATPEERREISISAVAGVVIAGLIVAAIMLIAWAFGAF